MVDKMAAWKDVSRADKRVSPKVESTDAHLAVWRVCWMAA